jgi:hypothetical protein
LTPTPGEFWNGPVDVTAHRILWECGRTRESLEDSFRVVHGQKRMVFLHPHHRCAVCDARVVSSARIYLTARCGGGGCPPTPPTREHTQLGGAQEEAEWLPQLMVRSFREKMPPEVVCAWRKGCVLAVAHGRLDAARAEPMFREVLTHAKALRFGATLEAHGIDASRLVATANGLRSRPYSRLARG